MGCFGFGFFCNIKIKLGKLHLCFSLWLHRFSSTCWRNSTNEPAWVVDHLNHLDFTTSILPDSTCRSETGSTALAPRRRASLWSWCTGQTCCAEKRKEANVRWREVRHVRYGGQVLTWTPGPRAACSDLFGCTDACSLRGSARGRRNGSESCTSPEEQQIERRGCVSASVKLLSYLPPLGWSTCWTSSPGRDTLPTTAQRSGRAEGQTESFLNISLLCHSLLKQKWLCHIYYIIYDISIIYYDYVIYLQAWFCDELKFQKRKLWIITKKIKITNCTVMAPGHVHFLQPTVGRIHPIFSAIKKQ